MKKGILTILLLVFSLFGVFAEGATAPSEVVVENASEKSIENTSLETIKKQNGLFVDGSFGPTARLLRELNLALGGHVNVNFFVVPEFSFGPYIHGEYFMSPLGSKSGRLAGLEMELETGINLTFPIYRSTYFTMKIGSDIGYYMQWLQYNSDISTDAHLSYNGLMIRPTFTIDFYHLWGMPIGISLYYQITAIMPYSDYNGFGIMVNL